MSGVFFTGSDLISRYVLKDKVTDHWAFSFYFSFVGALVNLPLMIINFKAPAGSNLWWMLFAVGTLIVINNFLFFRAQKFINPSLLGVLSKFRLLWILLLGVFILHESLTLNKGLGTLLVIVAGLLLIKYKKSQTKIFNKGMLYGFLATFFYAVVIILYKFLLEGFSPATLTFMIFAIPAVINFIVMPNRMSRISTLAKTKGQWVLLACALGAFANLFMNSALNIGEATQVIVIIESFLVAVLIGEHFILKEKKNAIQKLIAVTLAIVGAILVKIQ